MEDTEKGNPSIGLSPVTPTNGISRPVSPMPLQTTSVPGYPFVSTDPPEIKEFLRVQLSTPALDELSPYLWLVATQKGSHILPLHEHVIRGREIVKTEKAHLHLLWHRNRVFIKPLPSYTIDGEFHKKYLNDAELRPAVRGFLRSWTYLLQYPSDLEIALENKLLPKLDREEHHQIFSMLRDIQRLQGYGCGETI
jgi:hypothetical protein